MATQRINITELFQGSSNAHPSRRRPGQVDGDTFNVRFDTADGASKRNASEIVADLGLDTSKTWRFESFKRRYLVCIASDTVKVYDLVDGSEETVVSTPGDYDYLSTMTSADDIRVASLLETMVILNRQVTTSADASTDYNVVGDVISYDLLFETPTQADLDDGADDPTAASDGDVFEVLEDWNEARAGYYVKSTVDGDAVWTITTPPNDANAVPDATTLPHRLVHDTANDQFVWEQCPWRSRESGIDARNPAMSWFGDTLDDIAAHSGRLFLFGSGYVTAGEVAAPRRSVFNLYDYNVDVPTEADRIELAITDASLGDVQYSASLGNDLVLLCENGVDVFTSGNEPLTAFNGRDYKALDVPCQNIRPAASGTSLFFLDSLGKIHWLAWEGGAISYQGAVNDHRQDILENETATALYSADQTLFIVTSSGSVKTLDRYVRPEGNYQLAWGQLTFYENPVWFGHYGDTTKILTKDATEGFSVLEYLHKQPTYLANFDYEICLDRREAVTGTFNFAKNETVFEHTGRDASLTDTTLVVTTNPSGSRLNQPIKPIRVANNRAYFAGKLTGATHYIGFNYDAELVLSKLWAGTSDVQPLLSQFNVIHKDSTDYDVEITEEGETAESTSWTAARIGVSSLGQLVSETGVSRHMALGDARHTTLKIKSSSAGYFSVPAVEYRVRTRGRN